MEETCANKIRFFEPYVGKRYYKEGINGKKVLVLGASFYCEEKRCPYHGDCTSYEKRNTRNYDKTCPFADYYLSKEPSTAIEEKYDTASYQNFEIFLQAVLLKENPWDYVAFTNYVQFMLPNKVTEYWYLSDQDYEAFKEVVKKLTPDVIITWGGNVKKHIEKKIPEIKQELSETEGYMCYPVIDGINVTMVCLRHPSARNWGETLMRSYVCVKKSLN